MGIPVGDPPPIASSPGGLQSPVPGQSAAVPPQLRAGPAPPAPVPPCPYTYADGCVYCTALHQRPEPPPPPRAAQKIGPNLSLGSRSIKGFLWCLQ